MKHRRHFAPESHYQHGWNVRRPSHAVRENFLPHDASPHDFQTFPVNTLLEFFRPRIANSAIIAIACGAVGEHPSTIAMPLRYAAGKHNDRLPAPGDEQLFPAVRANAPASPAKGRGMMPVLMRSSPLPQRPTSPNTADSESDFRNRIYSLLFLVSMLFRGLLTKSEFRIV